MRFAWSLEPTLVALITSTVATIAACSPKLPCEETGTCLTDGRGGMSGGGSGGRDKDASVNPGAGGAPLDAGTPQGGNSGNPDGGLGGAAACTNDAQCGNDVCDVPAGACVACVEHADCASEKPVCDGRVCVPCVTSGNLGCAASLTCRPGVTPSDNSCVGCVAKAQCPGESICKDSECLRCEPLGHTGCSGDTPKCKPGATPAANECVACLSGADCPDPNAKVCLPDNACSTCDPSTHEGCSGATPKCKPGATSASNECVECRADADCPAGVCESNTCLPCVSATGRGCSGSAPICLSGATPAQNQCVECAGNTDCNGNPSGPFCEANFCVTCRSNADCTNPSASKCNAQNECTGCGSSPDCSHLSGKGVCDATECVACSPANETACGSNSCNPKTRACTTTPRGSLGSCKACVADSECFGGDKVNPDARCVPMTYKGVARPKAYCLRRVATTCAEPYTIPFDAVSLSTASSESYCGINQNGGLKPETSVTCEAVSDLIGNKSCTVAADCGGGEGGLCKTVGGVTNKCTYSCSGSSECIATRTCDELQPYCH
ncbi:MAG: hypothetical protein RJA70_4260 [Pseudomonadota bacterium]|jgi:Cys-rich repeat protein